MGSFNVACSISNLTINEGDRVKFFVLKGEDKNISKLSGSIIYNNSLMSPIALPLSGIYSDYGYIDADSSYTNSILLNHFGMSSKELSHSIIHGEPIMGEIYSGMYVLEDVFYSLVNYRLNEDNLYDSYLKPEYLEKIGLYKVTEDVQFFRHPHCKYLYRYDGIPYDIFVGNYNSSIVPMQDKQYYVCDHRFLNEMYRDWTKITGLLKDEFPVNLKGNEDATEKFKKVSDFLKKHNGVTTGFSKNAKTVYSVKDFVDYFENILGNNFALDLDYLKNVNVLDDLIDTAIDNILKDIMYYSDGDCCDSYNKDSIDKDFLNNFISSKPHLIRISSELQTFKGWQLFDELYLNAFLNEDEIRINIRDCIAFNQAMDYCNRFYFPSFNGEQFGDNDASKMLIEVSNSILLKRMNDIV